MLENAAVLAALEAKKPRTAWNRGVLAYAIDMVAELGDRPLTEKNLLGGAENWKKWSRGGFGLVYDHAIARRLCPPSVLKRKKDGELPPNGKEDWIDVETRAVSQAWRLVRAVYSRVRSAAA